MVFSSETFLFLFLPLFVGCYYLTPVRFRSWTLLLGSYTFYAWWRVDFLGLLVAVTLWTYVFGLFIQKYHATPRLAYIFCSIGVIGCLASLGVFKYFNFFVDSFAALFGTTPEDLGVHWRLILPIGISFYVFQSVSYLIDILRKDAEPTRSFVDFAAFIALFPQLIAGPILRFKDLADQIKHREHSWKMFNDGCARFAIGLAKKVLLADAVAPVADAMFALENPTMTEAWIGAIAYMLQLYFDFSGYSDMAIGLGMMFGFKFVENFNFPYISRSITEFWRRWHISLSLWLREYLYIPLGGSRVSKPRIYVNLVTVMVLGGLWHGANWTFILWGAWHGGILAIERFTGWDEHSKASVYALPMTLFFVLIGWVTFRAANVGEAFGVYAGMFGLNGIMPRDTFVLTLTNERMTFIILAVIVTMIEPKLKFFKTGASDKPVPGQLIGNGATSLQSQTFGNAMSTIIGSLLITVFFILTVAKLAEQSFSPFLYFQF